jgi:hypothetical protein
MVKTVTFLCGLLVVFIYAVSSSLLLKASDLKDLETLDKVYDRLINLQPDKSKTAFIEKFKLKRESATLEFSDGYFYFCKPVNKKLSAVLFIGNGKMAFEPSSTLEQSQLKHVFGQSRLNDSFNIAFIIFADSLMHDMKKQGIELQQNFTPGYVDRYIDDFLEYIINEEGQYLEVELIKTVLEGKTNGLFCAQVITHNHGRLAYEINPFEEEQVRLLKIHGKNSPREVISQFKARSGNTMISSNKVERTRIDKMNMTVRIDWDNELTAHAVLDVMLNHQQRWIYLNIDKSFEVEQVTRIGYGPVPFIKTKNRPYLWIKCDPYISPDEVVQYTIDYTGLPLMEVAGRLAVNPNAIWYPKIHEEDYVNYDLTFYSPIELRLSSVGEKMLDIRSNGFQKTRWVTKRPVQKITFSLGDFRELYIKDNRLPELYIWQYHATQAGEKIQNVGRDVAESYLLFQKLFGKRKDKQLWVSEIPFLHGEAYDGHINLTTKVFDDYKPYWNQIFTAHEVAHMWWGIDVNYKTYHDRWLAESFAEYSGLIYLEHYEKSPEASEGILNEWRQELIKEQQQLANSQKQLKSLWLGNRLAQQQHKRDFELIVYKKGAWVIHMLRHMMKDLESLDDQAFYDMLKAYYKTHKGQSVSTGQFKAFVESYTKQDLDWFFDQWVVGTQIPDYEYFYTYKKQAENTYSLRIEVRQKMLQDSSFKMIVPIQICFGDNQYLRFRAWVEDKKTVIELNDLPLRPKAVTFNYLNAVLCKQKEIHNQF